MLARCVKLARYSPVLTFIFYRLLILVFAEPDETETSFTGNAILKAREAAMASGKPALADDSGLAVTALEGAPGIYSARWAGPDRDFSLAMKAVETALAKTSCADHSAEFICALAIVWPDGDVVCVEGRIERPNHLSRPRHNGIWL